MIALMPKAGERPQDYALWRCANHIKTPHDTAAYSVYGESMRKRGASRERIGSMLLEHAAQEAKQRGAQSMEFMVWHFNSSAVSFYQCLGMMQQCILEKQL